MALASTVPASFICRRASRATLAAVMPVGLALALVLSTLPPNIGQSCAGKLAPAAALGARSRQNTIRDLMSVTPPSICLATKWVLNRKRSKFLAVLKIFTEQDLTSGILGCRHDQ